MFIKSTLVWLGLLTIWTALCYLFGYVWVGDNILQGFTVDTTRLLVGYISMSTFMMSFYLLSLWRESYLFFKFYHKKDDAVQEKSDEIK